MPKLTPFQWLLVIGALAGLCYLGSLLLKKKPAVDAGKPADKPADAKKESGYNAVDATMVSQGAGV